MKKKILLCFLLIFFTSFTVKALSWAIVFVVWNGNVYEVTEEEILESEIGKDIGEVKRKANDMTGYYYGDASNFYPKGTKYFEIKDIGNETAIAVEIEKGQWLRAAYVHEAPFKLMDLFIKILPFLILIVVTGIIIRMKKVRAQNTE